MKHKNPALVIITIVIITKSKKYWFEPQYEPYQDISIERLDRGVASDNKWVDGPDGQTRHTMNQPRLNKTKMPPIGGVKKAGGINPTYSGNRPDWTQLGRNKRAVWRIPTAPYADAHFATFPPALIETPIKSGCPEFICKKCGVAREVILETTRLETTKTKDDGGQRNYDGERWVSETKKTGYTDCKCNAGWQSGIVLDPFMGSGTTALMARHLGRRYIGIEINPEYIKLAERRLAQQSLL